MTRSERYGRVLGWGLVPLIAVMQFANLRNSVVQARNDLVSVDLVLYGAITLLCLPWTLRAFGELSRAGRWTLGVFAALAGYGLVTSFFGEVPTVLGVPVHWSYQVMPVVIAILSATTALSLVAAMPPRHRRAQLWWSAQVLIVTCYASWPPRFTASREYRLASGIGGAAVLYAALLLALALLVVEALRGYRRWASVLGALAAGVGILLTGSRAAFLCVGLFVVVAAAAQLRGRQMPRPLWIAAGAGAVGVIAFVALTPMGQRLLVLQDQLRADNLATSWRAWSESWEILLLGQGLGQVWPWYPFEAGYFVLMPKTIWTRWGESMPHPHSTYLLVAVELGMVGLALLALMVGAVWWSVWRLRGQRAACIVTAAVAASTFGWLFDTYLFRNFPLAIWWWVVLVSVVGFRSLDEPTTEEEPQPSAASAAS
ncbi:MAG: O-antigen ligase family protein [Propionibacteriaceae bacterium]|nr:O-antigen ligase family protein [Propionibacteriaceae bacterium]